jgi:LysM repeat protein
MRALALWRIAAVTACPLVAVACSGGAGHTPSHALIMVTTTTLAPTTTTAPIVRYQVKRGDTLSRIAARFHVTSASIVALNHLANPDQLAAGQMLSIPAPAAPPPTHPGQANLTISPPVGPIGQVFSLTLTGTKPGETITFQIARPDGSSFTGPAHTASASGQVTAGYATSAGEAAGQYRVTAKGNQGTSAQASFQVSLTATTTTSP